MNRPGSAPPPPRAADGAPRVEVARFGAALGGAAGPAPVVCAVAACNGLGFTAEQTWAFRRAELTAFVETPFRCTNGTRATMAHVRSLPPRSVGVERLVPIATELVDALLAPCEPRALGALRVATIVGLSERYGEAAPGQGGATRGAAAARARIEQALAEALAARGLGAEAGPPIVRLEPRGHAAFAAALLVAGAALAQHRLDAAIVGGLDTYYDPDVVAGLIREQRLFDGERLDGFIPGEGGALVLLARDASVGRRLGWGPPRARLEAVALGHEPAGTLRTPDVPTLGRGLSVVAQAVLEPLAQTRRALDWWLTDVTHEPYRVTEFQLAAPRVLHGIAPRDAPTELLPTLLGELGAATMPTAAAIAAEAFARGDPAARTCLITGSAVGTERGAVLLSAPEPR